MNSYLACNFQQVLRLRFFFMIRTHVYYSLHVHFNIASTNFSKFHNFCIRHSWTTHSLQQYSVLIFEHHISSFVHRQYVANRHQNFYFYCYDVKRQVECFRTYTKWIIDEFVRDISSLSQSNKFFETFFGIWSSNWIVKIFTHQRQRKTRSFFLNNNYLNLFNIQNVLFIRQEKYGLFYI